MSKVEIKCLGSGDAFGSGGRFQPCFYVSSENFRFLIDCGASSLIAMKRSGVDPSGVDLILISHLHGDHFGGIPFFILDGQFRRKTRPLIVAGPPGLVARVHQAMEVFFPGSSRVQQKFAIEFLELTERSKTTVGPLKVTPYSVVHASGDTPYALRIGFEDKGIAYSGDTEWTEALVEAAGGADLFICEAYYFEKKIKYHLSYQTLMEHRKKLDCRRLVLYHMSEDMLQRLPGLEVEWAEDGKSIIL
jgi:ribonuclease BN (tRNA processing enzyme)